MSETCWLHKKWNKIASDIKLVFYSSRSTQLICLVLPSDLSVVITIKTHCPFTFSVGLTPKYREVLFPWNIRLIITNKKLRRQWAKVGNGKEHGFKRRMIGKGDKEEGNK